MKNRILLIPVLLTLSACGHLARVPSQNEIQREAPEGGLVRVTVRDAKQPSRFTTYLVDVKRDEIVSKVDSPKRDEAEGQDSASEKSASASTSSFLISNIDVSTDCMNPETEPGCAPDFGSWNGDPHGGSGGGGDPTGHDPLKNVRRFAALSFWSIQQAGIPISKTRLTAPVPTRGQ